jgi:nifR3 family TIM-barrel protein
MLACLKNRHSLRIGSITLTGNAVLAPMSGVTDLGFRRAAMDFGAPLVVTEMVATREYLTRSKEAELRAAGDGVSPHMVQLAGCDPVSMAEAARLAEASGADIIDINMGCPARKVTGGLAGAALMRDELLAAAIIAAVVGAVGVAVTLKMRLGWSGDQRNAAQLAARAEALGVAMVTVHGRTRDQFYGGAADWRAVAEIRAAISVPLVCNGDIIDQAAMRTALDLSGADAAMIGRGAVGRPWLIAALARGGDRGDGPSGARRAEAAIGHVETLLACLGRERGLRHARKHLAAYAEAAAEDGFEVPPGAARELVTTDDAGRALSLLAAIYGSGPTGRVAA